MALFAIADLHFGTGINKTMDIFGEKWVGHTAKTVENWRNTVSDSDTVIIAGDISWGNNLTEAKSDLDLIESLPGRKIMLMGNHDYWWQSLNKVSGAYPNISFLQNNFFMYNDTAICGTRGWLCPNSTKFTRDDDKIYKREQIRLKLSLDAAVRAGQSQKILAVFHYPPVNDKNEKSGFTDMLEQYGTVKKAVYGHLHGIKCCDGIFDGVHNGIEYELVSADYLGFKPIMIEE